MRFAAHAVVVLACYVFPSAVWCQAPTGVAPRPARSSLASVTAMGVAHDDRGPAVEIVATRPVVPDIQQVERPQRLVIDLPKTRNAVKQKRLAVGKFQIGDLRIDQYQSEPPITRVVVDLTAPVQYSWETIGNRVLVHLKPAASASAPAPQPKPTLPGSIGLSSTPAPAVAPVVPVSGPAAIIVGGRGNTTSSITAGADTTLLRVARGGVVNVCPHTTVSVTSSKNGKNLLIGMNTGALETHYRLEESAADTIVTPDFRLLLPGPGEFDFAVAADSKGNTCVRALPGNAAALIVSELMGNRTYLVNPEDQVEFASGQLQRVSSQIPPDCGCPAAAAPAVLTATSQSLPTVNQVESVSPTSPSAPSRPSPKTASPLPATNAGDASPLSVSVLPASGVAAPASKPDDVHVTVEAPFVFRAGDPAPPSAPLQEAELLPARTVVWKYELPTAALPPVSPGTQSSSIATNAAPHRGVLGKIKGFFAAIFR